LDVEGISLFDFWVEAIVILGLRGDRYWADFLRIYYSLDDK
jgi:hypothetical protein